MAVAETAGFAEAMGSEAFDQDEFISDQLNDKSLAEVQASLLSFIGHQRAQVRFGALPALA